MFIAHGKQCLFERPAFDFGQKNGEFFVCGQWVSLFYAGASGVLDRRVPGVGGILTKRAGEASCPDYP